MNRWSVAESMQSFCLRRRVLPTAGVSIHASKRSYRSQSAIMISTVYSSTGSVEYQPRKHVLDAAGYADPTLSLELDHEDQGSACPERAKSSSGDRRSARFSELFLSQHATEVAASHGDWLLTNLMSQRWRLTALPRSLRQRAGATSLHEVGLLVCFRVRKIRSESTREYSADLVSRKKRRRPQAS